MLRQVESLTKKNGVLKAEVASAKNDVSCLSSIRHFSLTNLLEQAFGQNSDL